MPAAALAGHGGKCNASACKVYNEQGGNPAGPGGPSGPQAPQGQSTTPPATNSGSQTTKVPSKLGRVLAHAGNDKMPLKNLLGADANITPVRNGSGSGGSPSALGAAFDLGSGPTILLAILLATAIGLGLQGSVRNRRRRRTTG
jgi:hypothetical protein